MIVNGKDIPFQENMTISSLLNNLNLDCEKVVVELDKIIISREDFSKTVLKESSELEVISFVGGGWFMKIFVNEVFYDVCEKTAFAVRDRYKKDADIVILNGFPIKEDYEISEDDKIVLIKRGEMPSREELESLMVSRHTPKVHEAVKKARVAICGAGGLGSNVAISLARIGVGYIKIIDFDLVEPSNLNRQQYFVRQIGMAKVLALKENIEEINPFINVSTVQEEITSDNVEKLLKDVDIVVEAFDNPANKAMLVNKVLETFKKTKVVATSGMAGYYSNNIIKTRKVNSRFYICGDFKNEARINEGLMAPRVGIVANHEANTVLRLILNLEEVE